MIIALVMGVAGGAVMVFDSIGNPIAGQQGTEFAVNHVEATDSYQLVYASDSDLNDENIDVLEISNEDGDSIYQTPSDWDDSTLERGEIVHENVTNVDGFSPGDRINLIRHEDASVENGEIASQSGGERLQSVDIRGQDLDEYDIELIGDDGGGGEGGIGIDVG